MMIVVIITMIVVAVLYFAWDEISAARADRKAGAVGDNLD